MYDFIVVGGGSAGYAAARAAVGLGLKTAVIDGADELGGLCILRGCMPSKAIIESANRVMTLRRAEEFGLRCGQIEVRPEEIIRRKRALVEDFASYRRGQLSAGSFELIRGMARYLGPNRIQVQMRTGEERIMETRTSLIATGSTVSIPPVPGLAEAGYWTSDDVLEAEKLPSSIVVLGGGAIALELAHYLDAVGVRVTILQRSSGLLSMADPAAGAAVRDSFLKRGMKVECGTKLERVELDAEKRIFYRQEDAEYVVEAEEILVALGRKPMLENLGLESAGIRNSGGPIEVGSNQETSATGIYAAGDVCGPLEVVHLAIEQGELAAWNAARSLGKVTGAERRMDYRLKLFGVFSEPQVAVVGEGEDALRASGRRFASAQYPFADHGKSMVQGETDGFVKLWADLETGEILGGLVTGPEAVELIHEIVVAMKFHCTVGELARLPHYHPSLAEIWTYPAEELAEQVSPG